jgi:VIT1/CCC1 family predicted Fe2+/Mn2+ transporter
MMAEPAASKSVRVHLHPEAHTRSSETIRDVVIGMSDGLTVPFALAAGVSGAVAGTSLVITAGAAEIAAGAIAMGLGGYLAARTDVDHYRSEYKREVEETVEIPEEERAEVERIFTGYGITGKPLDDIVGAITRDRTTWVEFMMRFELGLEPPDERRAPLSALTIGASYILGGVIPLAPYVLVHDVQRALALSAVLTILALFIFGALKGKLTGTRPLISGLQAATIGGLAAGAAFMLARLIAH